LNHAETPTKRLANSRFTMRKKDISTKSMRTRMKAVSFITLVLMLIGMTACSPETVPSGEDSLAATPARNVQVDPVEEPGENSVTATRLPETPTAAAERAEPTATFTPAPEAALEIEEPQEVTEAVGELPMLPPFQEADASGIGDPLPGGEQDPFAEAVFILWTELPDGPQSAVVQEHSFGQMDEAAARRIADNLGFNGPLYVQQIPPEFAPPEGEDSFLVLFAFDGNRILNISDNGVNFEDRGVIFDNEERPVFAETAPIVESMLKAWGLLNFPYEIKDLDGSIVMIHRLIDGIASNQNEFNTNFNHKGELNYFDYHPLRIVEDWGTYPLQSAEMAWQQIQQSVGREGIRYQIGPLQPLQGPVEGFVNPRSWAPLFEPGQERHLYLTPAVFEAIDGSGLRLMFGDLTLTGDEDDLAEIASHLADMLHVWGTTGFEDGAKTLDVNGWEQVNLINYETVEGTVFTGDGITYLQTSTGEEFILPDAPDDIENRTEVYASIMAKRDAGAEYPLLDWYSLTEKIDWPDVPVATPDQEPEPITRVTIDEVSLIYYALYQTAGVPGQDMTLLHLPVWQFSGESDQGHKVTIWVPAVMPEYLESPFRTE
jgi:hypothetical protein